MSQKFLIFFVFILFFKVNAQNKLVITYEQVSVPKFLKPDGTIEEFDKELVDILKRPTFYELEIVNQQSMYSKIERVNNSQGGNSVTMSGLLPKNSFFDFSKNIQKRVWDMDVKKFIVVDSIPTLNYQLTRDKSTYLGYTVKKAILKENNSVISVWYSPDLPSKFGPSNYVNFPGLVLKVELLDAEGKEPSFTLKATEIKLQDDLELKKLFKGKEMTKAEFKLVEDDFQKRIKESDQSVDKD